MTEREQVPWATIEARCTALPVFPLPNAVLMPGSVLPLHIFEPRYRRMVAASLAGDRLLAIGTIRPSVTPMEGSPRVFTRVGIGTIEVHQPLPDGRSNLLLRAVAAADLDEELPEVDGWRRFRATPVAPVDPARGLVLEQLRALVLQIGCVDEESTREARRLVALEDEVFADQLAPRVLLTPGERLAYLSTGTGLGRAELLVERLATVLQVRDEPTAEA